VTGSFDAVDSMVVARVQPGQGFLSDLAVLPGNLEEGGSCRPATVRCGRNRPGFPGCGFRDRSSAAKDMGCYSTLINSSLVFSSITVDCFRINRSSSDIQYICSDSPQTV